MAADTIEDIVALGTPEACEAIEAWAQAARWQDLAALATALETRCPESGPENVKERKHFEEVLDQLEDLVALAPGEAAIDAAIALSLAERRRSVVVPRDPSLRVRALASRLGFAHGKDELLAALARRGDAHRELFACWLQEAVLRGASLAADPVATRFTGALGDHPLAALPLELREIEREAPSYMPLYGDKGLGRAIDALQSGAVSVRTIPPPAGGAAIAATRTDDAALVARLSTAVKPWTEGSRGKLEAGLFAIAPVVRPAALGSWLLRALPLESTKAAPRLECSQTPAHGVFGPLFSAATNGGAYSAGLGGAYGRLAAWTSLGALAGAPPNADVAAIEKAAGHCSFLAFRAPGPWFHDVAWDLGVLALREGGSTVAVLAATDAE